MHKKKQIKKPITKSSARAASQSKTIPAKTAKPSASKPVQTEKANVSRRYPSGRTLETQDKYLPTDKKGKPTNPKENRRVAIIDSNRHDELAVVSLTTQKQPNTTSLPTYKKGNKKGTYFKHFVEVEDNERNPIKVDGKKFKENPRADDLKPSEVIRVRETVLKHTKQSESNRAKIEKLKASDGKKGKKKR
jgi:hypothetical protein